MSTVVERGPWKIYRDDLDDKLRIASDDFTHDVALILTGDFENKEQEEAYAAEIVRRLSLL